MLLYTHGSSLEHDTGPGHPERAERIRAILRALDAAALPGIVRREAPEAGLEDIARAHPEPYPSRTLARIPATGRDYLDPDTVVSPGSRKAALTAAGGAVAAVEAVLAALAGGAAVAGHDWSPFLGFAGGRGVGTAMGALLVNAPAGVAVLGAGLAAGRLARRTSFGCFLAFLALVPVLARVHGRRGALAGAAVLVPLLAKRVAGNAPPAGPNRLRVYLTRLVHDQDEPPDR